jgi:hypothetical protein
MLDPTWDVVSTRTSAALLGSNNKELFGGEALWKAEGGIRVEDGEDHLCEEYNGGFGRQVASILIIAGVEGTICPYGSIWTGPTPIMEITFMRKHGPTWTHNQVWKLCHYGSLCLFGTDRTVLVAVT